MKMIFVTICALVLFATGLWYISNDSDILEISVDDSWIITTDDAIAAVTHAEYEPPVSSNSDIISVAPAIPKSKAEKKYWIDKWTSHSVFGQTKRDDAALKSRTSNVTPSDRVESPFVATSDTGVEAQIVRLEHELSQLQQQRQQSRLRSAQLR
jgi:hypothetical protein